MVLTGSNNNAAGSENVNALSNGSWSGVGDSILAKVQALALSNPVNGTLYAGTVTNVGAGDVYYYETNTDTWTRLGSQSPRQVYALSFNSNNNYLYAG